VLNGEGKPEMDFVGRHICLGDSEVLNKKGIDVDGCPVCKTSKETDAVQAPVQRYALNVVKYALKPGGFDIAKPMSVEVGVWSFSSKIFNQLVSFAVEWEDSGGLKSHDLLLGPCEVEQFQKFDIAVSGKAAWLESNATKKLVAETFKSSRLEDLTVAIGRKLSLDQVTEDLNKVLHANRLAFGGSFDASETEVDASLGLDDTDDLFGDTSTDDVAEVATPEVKEEASGGTEDLEDLLEGI
jgi:hypothetical protein